jgi:hypothetical protein
LRLELVDGSADDLHDLAIELASDLPLIASRIDQESKRHDPRRNLFSQYGKNHNSGRADIFPRRR